MIKHSLLLFAGLLFIACNGHPPPAPPFIPPDMGLPALDASLDSSLEDFGTDAGLVDGGREDAAIADIDAGPIHGISCKQIHEVEPTWGSACYTIDPDGPTGLEEPYLATCDMTTLGGGWTLVFIPHRSGDYRSSTLGYTYNSPSLFAGATEVLLAQRNLGGVGLPVVKESLDSATGGFVDRGNPVRFAIPSLWRIKSPFEYVGETETVTITTESGITILSVLKYGYNSWLPLSSSSTGSVNDCQSNWTGTSSRYWYGRLCVIKQPSALEGDPRAAAYWGFGVDSADYCNVGSGPYFMADVCSQEVAFTIAIR